MTKLISKINKWLYGQKSTTQTLTHGQYKQLSEISRADAKPLSFSLHLG